MLNYVLESFDDWDYHHLASALTCLYVLYYVYKVVHRPQLFAGEGKFKNLLTDNLTVLQENFWPTFWAFSRHHQTICRVLFKSKPVVPYVRETLTTKDSGHISLDWVYNDSDNTKFPDIATRPTVVVLPGITGCFDASYVRHVILESQDLGYRSLVFNNRGLGNTQLKTPRTFCACNAEDLEYVLNHVNRRFPESPIFIYAVSLGGVILTNYLSRVVTETNDNGVTKRPRIRIRAAFVLSSPWCSFETSNSLEQPVNWFLYNRFIVNRMKRVIKQNWTVFKENGAKLEIDLDHVMKATSIREFDERFTTVNFGFESCQEYYTQSSLVLKPLENIQVPMLFLNARDDPFAPDESIPIEAIKNNPNLALILTDYGGHIGFIEGFTVRGRSLVERMFSQYFSCMVEQFKKED